MPNSESSEIPSSKPMKMPPPLTRRHAFALTGIAALALAGFDSLTAPAAEAAAWGGFRNGEIPLSELTVVASTRLRSDAAAGMVDMMAAHRNALGTALSLTEGYRDLATQRQVYAQYGSPRAAKPGTSPHGWALAMDFGGPAYYRGTPSWNWLIDNSQRYGWWWAGGSFSYVEPWHWEFNGTYSSDPQTPPPPLPTKRNSMYIVHDVVNGSGSYVVTDNGVWGINGAQEEVLWRIMGSPTPAYVPLAASEITMIDQVLRANTNHND
jgi:hypothetical protein